MKKNSYQEDIRELLDWVSKEERKILAKPEYEGYQDDPETMKLHELYREKYKEIRKKHGLKPHVYPKNQTK